MCSGNRSAHFFKGFVAVKCKSVLLLWFCGTGIFFNQRLLPAESGGVSWKYSFRKIVSLLRIVILWNLLFLIVRIGYGLYTGNSVLIRLFDIPKEIIKSLLQKGDLWHFWYLGTLMILYLLLPFLSRMTDEIKVKLVGILIAFSMAIQCVSMILHWPVQSMLIQTFRLWTWVLYFLLGGILPKLRPRIEKLTIRQHGIMVLVLTVLVITYQNLIGRYIIKQVGHALLAEYFYDSILTIVWVIFLATFVLRFRFAGTCSKMIERINSLTMGVYIVHPIWMKIVKHFMVPNTILKSLLYFMVVSLGAALISHFMNKTSLDKYFIKI